MVFEGYFVSCFIIVMGKAIVFLKKNKTTVKIHYFPKILGVSVAMNDKLFTEEKNLCF